MGELYRNTAFRKFVVAYNNSYRILNRLPMRCSSSRIFATDNVNSCTCDIRKYILTLRLMTRTETSLRKEHCGGDVNCTSATRGLWICDRKKGRLYYSLGYVISFRLASAIPDFFSKLFPYLVKIQINVNLNILIKLSLNIILFCL